jgi:hypothetical protein
VADEVVIRKGSESRAKIVIAGALAAVVFTYVGLELYTRHTISLPPEGQLFIWQPLVRQPVSVGRAVPGLKPLHEIVTTNAHGLRGAPMNFVEPSDVQSIVTLGGSATECLLLNDDATWPAKLQENLRAAVGPRVWVGNGGQSGQMTADYISHMRFVIPQLQPDIVIVMPAGNDMQAAFEGRLLPMDLEDINVLTRYASRLYKRKARERFDRLEPSFWWDTHWGPMLGGIDFANMYEALKKRRLNSKKLGSFADAQDSLDVYRSNLDMLAASAPAGTRLVFLTHPYLYKRQMSLEEESTLWAGYTCMDCPDVEYYSHEVMIDLLETMNAITLETCDRFGLKCFDLNAKLKKDLENFYDDAHMTQQGAHNAAALVASFLLEQGLIR